MNICVCGGGNLGHVTAGFFVSHGHEVSILTSRPNEWASTIEMLDCNGITLTDTLSRCSSNPKDVIPCTKDGAYLSAGVCYCKNIGGN